PSALPSPLSILASADVSAVSLHAARPISPRRRQRRHLRHRRRRFLRKPQPTGAHRSPAAGAWSLATRDPRTKGPRTRGPLLEARGRGGPWLRGRYEAPQPGLLTQMQAAGFLGTRGPEPKHRRRPETTAED